MPRSKGGILPQNAAAVGEGCHRGIGGEHRKYVPCCLVGDDLVAAARNRWRLAAEGGASALKRWEEEERARIKSLFDKAERCRAYVLFRAAKQAEEAAARKASGAAYQYCHYRS